MKKLTLLVAILFTAMVSFAEGPAFKWDSTTIDLGTFKEGEKKTVTFTFTNVGDKPLVIYKASASCGCTTPEWPKAPIKPGEKGTITVTYDSADKPFAFQKSIWIMSNVASSDNSKNVELTIKGNVTKS